MPSHRPEEHRSRRGPNLDEVFGDVLPDTTRDERDRDDAGGDRSERDDWYERNRPPHHDRD